ncbi:hypothetical protein HY385_01950 [Candidatus Daviesbacteria bacterium]|nr:hypothetical protein [Candidatus Daviesbacteria bacterium]
MTKKYCILFAGPIGSSKTPIAHYLSYNFNLPIFSHDTIRTEVAEDLLNYDQQEYKKRKDVRLKHILERGKPFIYDASIDRSWKELKELLSKYNFNWFVINIDLSKEFLVNLCKIKGYNETLERIDSLIEDHKNFLSRYSREPNINITDQSFPKRLELVSNQFSRWLDQI